MHSATLIEATEASLGAGVVGKLVVRQRMKSEHRTVVDFSLNKILTKSSLTRMIHAMLYSYSLENYPSSLDDAVASSTETRADIAPLLDEAIVETRLGGQLGFLARLRAKCRDLGYPTEAAMITKLAFQFRREDPF
ncbi:hypothetical protein ACO2Q3_12555 [Caulobacter sp. KR2-114]|uniref:hypothetical protein n=1 Tax=Caulobacter sp. KR2-114 TaxID=3400912 RepID=UPI003C0BD30C